MHPFGKACGLAAIAFTALGLALASQTAAVHAASRVATPAPLPDDDPARPEFFTAHVKPIFDGNCARCHEGMNRRGGLNMDTRANLLKGGNHGPAVVPGDPGHSLLLTLIRHAGPADDPMDMPPHKPQLPDTDIATVAKWIQAGAAMPQ